MKSIKLLTTAAALCGLAACADNTPKFFEGFIADASMNTVTVKAPTADVTYTFSTTDADKSEANGLLPGAPVVGTTRANWRTAPRPRRSPPTPPTPKP